MANMATELAARLPALPRALPLRRYSLQIGTVAMAIVLWAIFAFKAPGTWVHSFDI